MAVTTFAAIDVGSYELELTIYEISPKKGIIQLDKLRKVIGLGKDTYDRGIISYDRVDEMCKLLHRFKAVMAEYQVDDYRACGTSAIREAENREVVLDQIKVRTGIEIDPVRFALGQFRMSGNFQRRHEGSERRSATCREEHQLTTRSRQCRTGYQVVTRCTQQVQTRFRELFAISQHPLNRGLTRFLCATQRLLFQR